MPEQTPRAELLDDEQLATFVRESKAMRDAETTVEAGVADFIARPFDQAAQQHLRALLDSDELQHATEIAHRLGSEL